MRRLADLVPFAAITPGRLLEALEQARPDLMDWSRADGAAFLPPLTLAALVLKALPDAFAATVQETAQDNKPLVNKPSIELLGPDGRVRWTLGFELELTPASAGQLFCDLRLAVKGADGQPVKPVTILAQPISGSLN